MDTRQLVLYLAARMALEIAFALTTSRWVMSRSVLTLIARAKRLVF